MGSVLHKVADPVDYRRSVHTPDYSQTAWFINPDVSAVENVPTKYWSRPLTDPVTEMTDLEKAAVDQAEQQAQTQQARDDGSNVADNPAGVGMQNRGLIQVMAKFDNGMIARLIEIQNVLLAMRTSQDWNAARSNIPAQFLPTETRDRYHYTNEYKTEIQSGNVDDNTQG